MTKPQQIAPLLTIAPYLHDPCFHAIEQWLTTLHEMEVTTQRQRYLINELRDPNCDENLRAIPTLRTLIMQEALFGPSQIKCQHINLYDYSEALLANTPSENKVYELFMNPDFMQTPAYTFFVAPRNTISAAYTISDLAANKQAMHNKANAAWKPFMETDLEFQALAKTNPIIHADMRHERATLRALATPLRRPSHADIISAQKIVGWHTRG